MLRSLRRSIGVRAARFHFRSSRDKVISFSHSIATSDRVLVVMPLDHPLEEGQTHVLTFLREHFYEPDITVVAPAGGTPVERALPRCRVVLVGPDDVNAFFLPRRSLLTRVAERSYDLAIDLNLDFMIPSAYICKETDARVRTGFAGIHADSFFNFQVRLEPASQRSTAYDRLVQCLQMFFSGEGT
jgi:ADP-heptose:LPS heptosyltransferase